MHISKFGFSSIGCEVVTVTRDEQVAQVFQLRFGCPAFGGGVVDEADGDGQGREGARKGQGEGRKRKTEAAMVCVSFEAAAEGAECVLDGVTVATRKDLVLFLIGHKSRGM